jgi:hypothetical protein
VVMRLLLEQTGSHVAVAVSLEVAVHLWSTFLEP